MLRTTLKERNPLQRPVEKPNTIAFKPDAFHMNPAYENLKDRSISGFDLSFQIDFTRKSINTFIQFPFVFLIIFSTPFLGWHYLSFLFLFFCFITFHVHIGPLKIVLLPRKQI